MPAMVGSPSALPRPSTPEPTPMPTVPTQEASFWIVAMARGERVGRVPLVPVPGGWEGAMRVDRSWRDRGVVVELVGRQPDGPEHVLSSVGVPRFSGRLLELPLELAKGELVIEEPVASPPPGSDGRFDIVRQLLTLRHSLELQEGRGTIMRLRAVVSVDAAMQVTFLGDPAPPSP
jgi:hypothetical protein